MNHSPPKNTLSIFHNNKALLKQCLTATRDTYRSLDPGWYLYKQVLKVPFAKKFTPEFIELVYVTLTAWNMNSRGAKLQEFDRFSRSILVGKDTLTRLNRKTILQVHDGSVKDDLRILFFSLDLVAPGKPKLVTLSKTLHFLLPELVVPIDRRYTLTFYYGNTSVPKNEDRQFDRFSLIQTDAAELAGKLDLSRFKDEVWNGTVPKIIDNLIIGYIKKNSGYLHSP